ncbi:Os04g0498725 [Oryza sativa Japonica Group]|uniref:Os04g0498725 protein n=1 Tax=Oryza sativa subsp. japonica TaxID=39947 RepID=A0A0N7KJB0_ORYSJ|nr:hypothetical protein EE612_024212 [Oryza sativa]BAS89913.1 Os04g0498725 [Oryza sativa Japonica Group]
MYRSCVHASSAVDAGARPADLAVGAGPDAEAGEPGERGRPAGEEAPLAPRERLHRGPRRGVLHQHGVRAQQPAPGEQVGEVGVVEPRRRPLVAVHRRRRRHRVVHRRARPDQPPGVVRVHRRVRGHRAPVRVHPEPLPERRAVRRPDACVCVPERVTRSSRVSPLAEKLLAMASTEKPVSMMFALTLEASETRPSSLPRETGTNGPPVWFAAASLAARTKMSLQETVTGHTASSSLLAASMTLNPPSERFAGSVLSVPLPSIITDASHPSTKQSWKSILRSLPGMVESNVEADLTTSLTASSTLGQDCA